MQLTKSAADVFRKRHRNRRLCKPSLSCPICENERLIDTSELTHSKTYVPGQTGYMEADYYQKCKGCKEQIGIKKIE